MIKTPVLFWTVATCVMKSYIHLQYLSFFGLRSFIMLLPGYEPCTQLVCSYHRALSILPYNHNLLKIYIPLLCIFFANVQFLSTFLGTNSARGAADVFACTSTYSSLQNSFIKLEKQFFICGQPLFVDNLYLWTTFM